MWLNSLVDIAASLFKQVLYEKHNGQKKMDKLSNQNIQLKKTLL